jgi:hypothetical protein
VTPIRSSDARALALAVERIARSPVSASFEVRGEAR